MCRYREMIYGEDREEFELSGSGGAIGIAKDVDVVEMTAYGINGNNYVMLRNIGKAVGFNVYWNSANHCVQVESDKPYTGVASVGSNAVSAPKKADYRVGVCSYGDKAIFMAKSSATIHEFANKKTAGKYCSPLLDFFDSLPPQAQRPGAVSYEEAKRAEGKMFQRG